MLNIAEGFLRRLDNETLQFLRYSFASNGELKAAYYAAIGRKYLAADEAAELIALNEGIARMLRRWLATLKPKEGNSTRSDKGRWNKGHGQTKDHGTKD